MEAKQQLRCLAVFLFTLIVLLSHPITFLFLATGLISMSLEDRDSMLPRLAIAGGILIAALLISFIWPYFPMIKLIMGDADVCHGRNRVMYQHVLPRIWPTLIALPLVIAKMRHNWRQPLVLMPMILSVIYVFGALTGKYAYGRSISYIVFLLQIIIAEKLSVFESSVHIGRLRSRRWQLIIPGCVLIVSLALSLRPLLSAMGRAFRGRQTTYESYLFLSRFTGQYDVILSDIKSSWMVPTFGGKVVAALRPLAFVPDHGVRRSDMDRFFKRETTPRDRQQIIETYGVNHVLLRKSPETNLQKLEKSLTAFGRTDFESDNFVLISLKRHHGKGYNPSKNE